MNIWKHLITADSAFEANIPFSKELEPPRTIIYSVLFECKAFTSLTIAVASLQLPKPFFNTFLSCTKFLYKPICVAMSIAKRAAIICQFWHVLGCHWAVLTTNTLMSFPQLLSRHWQHNDVFFKVLLIIKYDSMHGSINVFKCQQQWDWLTIGLLHQSHELHLASTNNCPQRSGPHGRAACSLDVIAAVAYHLTNRPRLLLVNLDSINGVFKHRPWTNPSQFSQSVESVNLRKKSDWLNCKQMLKLSEEWINKGRNLVNVWLTDWAVVWLN